MNLLIPSAIITPKKGLGKAGDQVGRPYKACPVLTAWRYNLPPSPGPFPHKEGRGAW